MGKKVFYSFYYKEDSSRIQQVINMGAVEGQTMLTGQKWEEVEKGGDAAVERWISDQMKGKSCVVVLVGTNTSKRRWVGYEIKKAWSDKLGVVGIRIHGLKDLASGLISAPGGNPFSGYNISGKPFADIVKLYNSPGNDSKGVYASIKDNIGALVDEAIKIRNAYP